MTKPIIFGRRISRYLKLSRDIKIPLSVEIYSFGNCQMNIQIVDMCGSSETISIRVHRLFLLFDENFGLKIELCYIMQACNI